MIEAKVSPTQVNEKLERLLERSNMLSSDIVDLRKQIASKEYDKKSIHEEIVRTCLDNKMTSVLKIDMRKLHNLIYGGQRISSNGKKHSR